MDHHDDFSFLFTFCTVCNVFWMKCIFLYALGEQANVNYICSDAQFS